MSSSPIPPERPLKNGRSRGHFARVSSIPRSCFRTPSRSCNRLPRRHPRAHRLRPRRPGFLLDRRDSSSKTRAISEHERFHHLELLRRAGILDELPQNGFIRLEGAPLARSSGLDRFRQLGLGVTVIGVSPGAAYGVAKCRLPQRFVDG